MRTIVYPCPACRQNHALCYLHTKSGKQLGVNCDDDGKTGRTKFVPIPKAIIDVSDLSESDLSGVPEFFTPQARQKLANQQNLGMPLMFVQPGEVVERTIDLPRAIPTDEPNPSHPDDKAEARRLKAEISQIVQAQKELSQQIESLAKKRIGLESKELDLRRQLKAVWTERLDFQDEVTP